MILLDLSQLMISNIMMSIKTANDIDEDFARHMILNSIRLINVKFGKEYGDLVVCCDSGKFWRRDVFQYYKAGRKKARDDSALDWKKIFGILNKIKEELNENFHYRVVQFEGAEADDVIAILGAKDSIEHINNHNKIMIVSGDKDFIQLHRYPNIEQWDPVHKKKIVHNNPYRFLREHIIRGDTGDGVPNFLSPDNALVMGIRQKPVTQKILTKCLDSEDPTDFCDTEEKLLNFRRNETMIDLGKIPEEIKVGILEKYDAQAGKKKSKMLKYFLDNKLSNLFSNINDF